MKPEPPLPYSERLKLIKLGLLPKEAVAKKRTPIKKQSEKKKAEVAAEREARGGGETELVKWFKRQMKVMPDTCEETGLKIETKIYRYAINSICHILSQQHCPSVAFHPLNRMFFDPGFHVKFDKMNWDERGKLGCWPLIRERLISVWPDLRPSEHRHFPPKLRQWIEDNEPF